MKNINESSLSRVWQHAKSDRPFALFTAFRNEVSDDEKERRNINVTRNKEAANILRSVGYGYFFVDGYWIENEGTEDEVEVAEDSIFVIGDADKEEKFVKLIVALGKEYNQDAVLIKTSEGVHLYNQAGRKIADIGTLVPGKMGDIYTKLRGKNQTFVFEAERSDSGFAGAMVRKAQKVNESTDTLARMKRLAGIIKE